MLTLCKQNEKMKGCKLIVKPSLNEKGEFLHFTFYPQIGWDGAKGEFNHDNNFWCSINVWDAGQLLYALNKGKPVEIETYAGALSTEYVREKEVIKACFLKYADQQGEVQIGFKTHELFTFTKYLEYAMRSMFGGSLQKNKKFAKQKQQEEKEQQKKQSKVSSESDVEEVGKLRPLNDSWNNEPESESATTEDLLEDSSEGAFPF